MHKATGVAIMAKTSQLGSPEKKVGNHYTEDYGGTLLLVQGF